MAGVPTRMLRNLGILKIILSLPTLSDQKIEGPSDVKRMAKHIKKNGTDSMVIAITTKIRSRKRFINEPSNKRFKYFSIVFMGLINGISVHLSFYKTDWFSFTLASHLDL